MSAFDALAAAHRLEDAGMARQQAEAVIEIARDAAASGEPATKSDLSAAVAELKAEILKWMIAAGGIYAGLVIAAVKLIRGP